MFWFDWGCPQSAVALHIYRVGRSVPVRNRNPIKSRVKMQLLTRTGHFGPVWLLWTGLTGLAALDWSNRSDQGAGLPGGITPSSGLQIERSIYAFQSYQRDLRNSAVQLAIWQICLDRSDRFLWEVWPVCPNCLENLNRLNFGCQQIR